MYFRFSLALDLIQEHHKLTGCVTAATAAAAAAKETKIDLHFVQQSCWESNKKNLSQEK